MRQMTSSISEEVTQEEESVETETTTEQYS